VLAVSNQRWSLDFVHDRMVSGRPKRNDDAKSFDGRMRDELLNETLSMSLAADRVEVAGREEDYDRARPHSSLGYATPAAFAAELDRPLLQPR